MLGEKPQFIRRDENEFLQRFEGSTFTDEGVTVNDYIVDQLLQIESKLHDPPKNKSNAQESRKSLMFSKDVLLFRLLEQRGEIPDPTIQVAVADYHEEELHSLSSNMLVISANDHEEKPHEFITSMDFLARTRDTLDSTKVLEVIGEIDSRIHSSVSQFLERTFIEARRAREILEARDGIYRARFIRSVKKVYNTLLPNRIKDVCDNEEITVGFDSEEGIFSFKNYRGITVFSSINYDDVAHVINKSGKLTIDQQV